MTLIDEHRAHLAGLLVQCSFPPIGSEVTCAVSGGADSSALAVLAVAAGCRVTAIHVDHGLRPGSAAEAEVVAELAGRIGARFESRSVTVDPGPNLEARCRQARRSVLPSDVLTGHTADDQAETLLLNLIRGAGLDGLAAMAPAGHPILALRRAQTHGLCRRLGLSVVVDPTNSSRDHRRNRVRGEVLALLDDVAERDVAAVLARQCSLIADDLQVIAALAGQLDPTDAKALVTAPVAIARRALRGWLSDPYPPDAATLERVLQVARGERLACELAGGRRVERHHQRLTVVVSPGP